MVENPLLSIVISSYSFDRVADTLELLDSMKMQTYQNIQLIMVIERSKELFERISAHIEKIGITNHKLEYYDKIGLAPSRNRGIELADGEVVVFLDDDTILFPDWADELAKTFRDEAVIGVTGPAIPKWGDASSSWLPEEFHWLVGGTAWFDGTGTRPVRNVWGMNMAFQKYALLKNNFKLGHDASPDGVKVGLEGDDTELSIRIQKDTGKKIVFNPRVQVYHRVPRGRLTKRYIRQKAYWQGYTKAYLARMYGNQLENEKTLGTEYILLRRIFCRLLPGIIGEFFRRPSLAWRKLRLTVTVLYHLSLGYFSARYATLEKLTHNSYKK